MVLGYDDIAKVVSNWTGVPVSKMTMEESQRLLNLEDTLHKRSQDRIRQWKLYPNAVRRARVGLKESTKPVGNF